MAKSSASIWRALVQHQRATSALAAALTGGFHESFAPERVKYPFATYNPVVAPYEDAWGSRMTIALVDIFIFSRDQVEARNLDQSFIDAFDGAHLTVSDVTTLICRRVADVQMPPDLDEEGKKVYQVGGSYEIWTNQSLP
jgi:hypothetical protein